MSTETDTQALYSAPAAYVGFFCGVKLWRVPGAEGHLSKEEALAWLGGKEAEG